MPSHVRRVLFLILVTLPFLMAPRSAAAEGGISFLGDQPLTIVLPDGQADVRHSVKVMNGGDTSQDIYLDLVGLSDEDGAPVPSGVLPGDLLREENVASGEVRTFELTLTRVDGLSGSYTGQLVAYGDDGTVARLVFTLTVEKPEVGVPKIVPLQPDYLDEVTLPGLKRWPCPLSAFGLDCIKPITAPMGEPASEPQVVGGISGSNGQLGQVVWEGTTLRVEGITRAGEYTGKVDLAPDDEEAGEVTLKVQVRDCIIWPVLVLVAGLLISTWLAQQGKVRRPLKRLQIGLAKLKEHAIHLQQEANKALPDNWPATRDVYRVYQMIERTESGLLYTAAKNVEEAFIEAGSDEERKNWGPDGDEFKRVQGYVDALPGLYTLSRAAAGHYRELKLFVSVHDPVLDFDGLEVAKRVRGVLEPTLIDSAPNLEKLQTELKAASIFVSDFRELHKRLVNLKRLAQGTSYESDVDDLYGQLTGSAVVSADILEPIAADTTRLELIIKAPGIIPQRAEEAEGIASLTLGSRAHLAAWPRFTALALPDPRGLLGLLQRVEDVSRKTSADLQKELRRLDLAFNVISGIIVVFTGLSVLYLGKASFGSLADYAGVLLWGTAVDEGFKLARQLAPGLMGRVVGR